VNATAFVRICQTKQFFILFFPVLKALLIFCRDDFFATTGIKKEQYLLIFALAMSACFFYL